MSELYGRQLLFFGTYMMLTAFNAGAAGSQNIQTLIILRFFAGAFGSSPLTNAGGVIADMFPANQRGLAAGVFASAPFLGPTLGPIIGGFLGETKGWRWVEGLMAIFTGALWIIGAVTIPETYSPLILRRRAKELSKRTGKCYKSKVELENGTKTAGQEFKTALSRPWILLFREPIVFLLSVYMAIIYGTLYMLFGAFPIVYQEKRGWSAGIGGLSFLGVSHFFRFFGCENWGSEKYLTYATKSLDIPRESQTTNIPTGNGWHDPSRCLFHLGQRSLHAPRGKERRPRASRGPTASLLDRQYPAPRRPLLVRMDKRALDPLGRLDCRGRALWFRHGAGVFEHHELSH